MPKTLSFYLGFLSAQPFLDVSSCERLPSPNLTQISSCERLPSPNLTQIQTLTSTWTWTLILWIQDAVAKGGSILIDWMID